MKDSKQMKYLWYLCHFRGLSWNPSRLGDWTGENEGLGCEKLEQHAEQGYSPRLYGVIAGEGYKEGVSKQDKSVDFA